MASRSASFRLNGQYFVWSGVLVNAVGLPESFAAPGDVPEVLAAGLSPVFPVCFAGGGTPTATSDG